MEIYAKLISSYTPNTNDGKRKWTVSDLWVYVSCKSNIQWRFFNAFKYESRSLRSAWRKKESWEKMKLRKKTSAPPLYVVP